MLGERSSLLSFLLPNINCRRSYYVYSVHHYFVAKLQINVISHMTNFYVIILQANGGNGYNSRHRGGGGGSGGRIAVYYRDNEDYDGIFEAYGGFGNDEYGGAGTIYHHHMISDNVTRRSLYVNNNGHAPQTQRVNQVTYGL